MPVYLTQVDNSAIPPLARRVRRTHSGWNVNPSFEKPKKWPQGVHVSCGYIAAEARRLGTQPRNSRVRKDHAEGRGVCLGQILNTWLSAFSHVLFTRGPLPTLFRPASCMNSSPVDLQLHETIRNVSAACITLLSHL